MPDYLATPEQQTEIYSTLKLYEAVQRLCFEVVNRRVISTEADDVYIYLGIREQLEVCLSEVTPLLSVSLPENVLPETVSSLTNKQYLKLQAGFGIIKQLAKDHKVHGVDINTEVATSIKVIKRVCDGEVALRKILLSESEIGQYDYDTKTLIINDRKIRFNGAQEDYFMWAMFRQKVDLLVSWDEIYEQVKDEFGDAQVFKGGQASIYQAHRRINGNIKRDVGTTDNFFTYETNGYRRNYGPEPLE